MTGQSVTERAGVGPVTFVLGGGANLGAVQVGMLRALVEAGIQPDLVVATSVGALNGGFFVSRPDLRGIEALSALWCSMRRPDVFRLRPTSITLGLLGRRDHLIDSRALRRMIHRNLGFTMLESAPIPFVVVATDLESTRPVILRSGPADEALLATTALPGIFPPVRIDGRDLIDGGVVADLPVEVAVSLGAGTIYALPTVPEPAAEGRRGALTIVEHVMNQLTTELSKQSLERVRASGHLVHVLPSPEFAALSMFDFSRSAELIAAGYEGTRTWLRASSVTDSGGRSHLVREGG